MKLETGKLDSELLKKIVFDKITYKSDEVKVRPAIGEDCAVLDFGDYDCIMSTDPISSAVSDVGRLSIHITCNDIASNGVKPLGIMLVCMLPEGITDAYNGASRRNSGRAGRRNNRRTYGSDPRC